jgi:hypothetical protein
LGCKDGSHSSKRTFPLATAEAEAVTSVGEKLTTDVPNATMSNASWGDNVSNTADTASMPIEIRDSSFIDHETSNRTTTLFVPLAADTYHCDDRYSKSVQPEAVTSAHALAGNVRKTPVSVPKYCHPLDILPEICRKLQNDTGGALALRHFLPH